MALILERGDTFYGRGLNLTIISIVFTITAVGFVGARLASRMTTGRKFGLDDHAIILSVVRLPAHIQEDGCLKPAGLTGVKPQWRLTSL